MINLRSWFAIPLILVVVGILGYILYNNDSVKMQVMNFIPSSQSEVANQASDTVVIKGFKFGPSTITISAGSSVTWENQDSSIHTATSDEGTWDTGQMANGESKTVTFANPGTYSYHCTLHPGMTGKVVVK